MASCPDRQTYWERHRSWTLRPYEHNPTRESLSREEGLAIDGIMALLPPDIVDWEMGPWPDTLNDALHFLREHLIDLSGQREPLMGPALDAAPDGESDQTLPIEEIANTLRVEGRCALTLTRSSQGVVQLEFRTHTLGKIDIELVNGALEHLLFGLDGVVGLIRRVIPKRKPHYPEHE